MHTALAEGRTRTPNGALARIAAIDGLRAVAVLGVMAFHFGFPLRGGFLGVDLFFVISGFVITRRLLAQHETLGGIPLHEFWLQRAKRLLPAVMVVLVAVQIWVRVDASYSLRMATNSQTLAALAYVSNWHEIFQGDGYWRVDSALTPLTHLWSLAVEEQFYLIWPFVIILLVRYVPEARRALVIAGAAAFSYVLAAVTFITSGYDRAYEGTDTRAGALLLGALVAVAWGSKLIAWVRSAVAGIVSVALLGILWCVADVQSPALYFGGLALSGIAGAVLIGHLASASEGGLPSLLTSRPARAIGAISYGLYLWHWPVWVYVNSGSFSGWSGWLGAPAILMTFVLATASYFLLERPIRRSQVSAKWALVAFGSLALVIALSAVLFQPAAPLEQTTGVVVDGPAG